MEISAVAHFFKPQMHMRIRYVEGVCWLKVLNRFKDIWYGIGPAYMYDERNDLLIKGKM